ncbi:cyclic lactone autoinducer peptide [Lachnotalea glycerini]|jgi:cyclic lactone autoinducer peptide|uniref:Cyclic lactone autoinducer peptide n=1 Tax=Lachnotalea glycerini TaxID=1763509 RepID=A0A255IJT4_9FIRM|nr:cyclic lactone autoinducer peptide [Lachnotalea glycerini]PXV89423.1 cyclic lactone autoinducer peptide [Lachnotalea glycerini]RDY32388.1 cyclic lactone autoinducer peptide [Lachnotalea glycerini]
MREQLKKVSMDVASKIILNSAQKEVNSACFFLGYQPQIPKAAKKLRKF